MVSWHIQEWWPQIVALLSFALSAYCSGHAVLNKRDSRSATGWVGIIWLAPFVGISLYWLLGRNRVRRLAKVARTRGELPPLPLHESSLAAQEADLARNFPANPSLISLARLGTSVTQRRLLWGNRILPLENGDAAYPEMLAAIEGSKRSITLSTYIFDNDRVGKLFIEGLSSAVARGVQVRVLIDDIGLRYSWLSVLRSLRKGKVPVARFMGALRPRTFPHLNLRKHRKILLCDGRIAFTGGMNPNPCCEAGWQEVIGHDRIDERLDGEEARQLAQAVADPNSAVFGILLPVGVPAAENGAYHTARNTAEDDWFPPVGSRKNSPPQRLGGCLPVLTSITTSGNTSP